MDPRGVASFPFLLAISILGIIRWRHVISGERDLYTRIHSTWPWSRASARAYARCFPLMILVVWLLTAALGLLLAEDAGAVSLNVVVLRWVLGVPAGGLLLLAAGVALVNKPTFIVPRTKRQEPGMLHREAGRHSQ